MYKQVHEILSGGRFMSKEAKNLIVAAMVLCSINTVFSSMPANASTYSEASKGDLKSLNVYV